MAVIAHAEDGDVDGIEFLLEGDNRIPVVPPDTP
jgi:hypothetical protein